MNSTGLNSQLLNSFVPKPQPSFPYGVVIFTTTVIMFLGLLYYFRDEVTTWWNGLLGMASSLAPAPAATPAPFMAHDHSRKHRRELEDKEDDWNEVTNRSPQQGEPGQPPELSTIMSLVENVLPGSDDHGNQVFNISSNNYTYYDSEPLCKALGAELATYDQVKEAWSKGADWCNYGWTKGQMALYPTSDDTYEKLQKGPEDQRMACGRPGMNGGFFDNPELRFGVNCYGQKPPQSKHDEQAAAQATPVSPDALKFDKKVAHYKQDADNIGILPFNTKSWD